MENFGSHFRHHYACDISMYVHVHELTLFFHSSKTGLGLSLVLNESPSSLSFCPSMCVPQSVPRTASTRARYISN